jgi:hypothetical protein
VLKKVVKSVAETRARRLYGALQMSGSWVGRLVMASESMNSRLAFSAASYAFSAGVEYCCPWACLFPVKCQLSKCTKCGRGGLREALLFSRFCNFLRNAVLDFPVQSSFISLASNLCGMGTTSIFTNWLLGFSFDPSILICKNLRALATALMVWIGERNIDEMRHADSRFSSDLY